MNALQGKVVLSRIIKGMHILKGPLKMSIIFLCNVHFESESSSATANHHMPFLAQKSETSRPRVNFPSVQVDSLCYCCLICVMGYLCPGLKIKSKQLQD